MYLKFKKKNNIRHLPGVPYASDGYVLKPPPGDE